MKKSLSIIVAAFFLLCDTLHAQDVPRIISYQGVLVDANGKPITSSPQNPVKIKFEIINSSNQLIKDIGTESAMTVVGGLFTRPLDLSGIPQNDLNQQLFLRLTVNDGTPYPPIPLYSTISALNIPDNVVTSQKIKDGEVGLQDLAPGNTPGEILKWDGTQWVRGQDEGLRSVTVEQPIEGDGTSTDPLRVTIPSGVPIGTIVAFYGLISQIHPDWLLCDGRSITQQQYPLLFNHLNELYNSSILPDLRGMFLRGADLGTNQDPDNAITAGKRQYPTGIGANTDKIGSAQQDAFQVHWHEFIFMPAMVAPGNMGINQVATPSEQSKTTIVETVQNPITDKVHGIPRTSSETRPKNVYVNYIIKAK